jgi:hypothetical protein
MSSMATRWSRWSKLTMLTILATALVACESSKESDFVSRDDGPILVQDGAAYVFEPSELPSDDARSGLTAQQAYNAILRERHHGPMLIPATTTTMYGYLTEDDTSPPADRMAVWAFRVKGGCINTFKATQSKCYQWTFARAADGKDLRVMDQQTVS